LDDLRFLREEEGLSPDLIFVTGDLAFSGAPAEYALTRAFFDDLLEATGLARERLFPVPGNHDVDRGKIGVVANMLASKVSTREAVNQVLGDAAACYVAVRGTSIRTTPGAPTASAAIQSFATTSSGFGWWLRPLSPPDCWFLIAEMLVSGPRRRRGPPHWGSGRNLVKNYRNLYAQVCDFENLYQAYRRARKGKRGRPEVAAFEFSLETELVRLQDELAAKTYCHGTYRSFTIHEPKRRLISAAPFRDRVVHHALMGVIQPIFEWAYMHDIPQDPKPIFRTLTTR